MGFGNEAETLTLDLHGMDVSQAKKWLMSRVTGAPKEIKQILVVHGYRGGTALQTMVRKSFSHPRVKGKIIPLNQGSTILVLK